jgi:hydrogenase maturation protease
MNIFHLLGSYETVIIIDAVDFDASAGDFIFFAAKEIKESKKLSSSISTHGCDVFSVIKNVEKYSDRSPRIFIFGVQPKQVTLSKGFSEEVQKNIPVYVDRLIQRIKEHMG